MVSPGPGLIGYVGLFRSGPCCGTIAHCASVSGEARHVERLISSKRRGGTDLECMIRLYGIQRALVAHSLGFQKLLHIRQLLLEIRKLAFGVLFLLFESEGRVPISTSAKDRGRDSHVGKTGDAPLRPLIEHSSLHLGTATARQWPCARAPRSPSSL